MKRIIILSFIVSLSCLMSIAQEQTYNWAFGYQCGLTWNSTRTLTCTGMFGIPDKTFTDMPDSFSSAVNAGEGCFTLSDADGKLLFYSDGITVYNRNNTIMPNGTGLNGDPSSAQSGVVVPYPGEPDKYLAISLGMRDAGNLTYSVIDVTADGGLGDIDPLQKNVPFLGGVGGIGENVTSVVHPNGTDFWIIAPGRGNPTYINAWLFTPSGVSNTPVVSTTTVSTIAHEDGGYFKITPEGKHFVWTTMKTGHSLIYGDFDAMTGQFSNVKSRAYFYYPYGLEFSPNQELVFISDLNYGLTVYKLDELFSQPASATLTHKLFPIPLGEVTALQIGPDNRIYFQNGNYTGGPTFMRFIDNADDFDNLQIYQTPLNFAAGIPRLGLPSFAASWFRLQPKEKPIACTANKYHQTVELDMSGTATSLPTTMEWNFGDGTVVTETLVSGVSEYTQSHTYSTPGTYVLTITSYKSDGSQVNSVQNSINVVDCVIRSNPSVRTTVHNSTTLKL